MIVSIDIRSYNRETEVHNHDYHQIVLPRRGRLDVEVAGRGGVVDRRRGLFIPAGDRHDFRAEGENAFFVIDLPSSFFDAAPNCARFLDRFGSDRFFEIRPDLDPFLGGALFIQSTPGNEMLTEVWTQTLVKHIANEEKSSTSNRSAVARALDFIRRNIKGQITVSDIAREAGVSLSVLYDLFKEETGTTPYACLRNERLEYALELLASSPIPISEIAVYAGYEGQSAFSRALKEKHGVTPAAWRRAAREGELERTTQDRRAPRI